MLKKMTMYLLTVICTGAFIATIFGYFARWINLAEFVVSLRPFIFWMTVPLLPISLYFSKKHVSWLVILSLCLNGLEFAPYVLPAKPAPNKNLTILFYNVDKIRFPLVGVDEVIGLITDTQPDIAVLREVGVTQVAELRTAFESDYPYTINFQHADIDGFLIISRYPLANSEITQLGGGRQVGITNIKVDSKSVHLVAPHPTNALHGIEERNQQLTAIAKYVETAPRPLIVVGDLNVTMWSGWYKGIERAGVRNVRVGHGIMPTWKVPDAIFPETLVYIPLDHILVSEAIGVFSAQALPTPGSDHQPILAHLAIE